MEQYNFQNCQKIVVFSKDKKKVLLCKRKGEADYDGIFSFIGGKMETTDSSLLEGLQREKNEEVGSQFKIKLYPTFNTMLYFQKKAGNCMVLPHYYAEHLSGKVILNEEYSDYQWVDLKKLKNFEPKINTSPKVVDNLLRLKKIFKKSEFIVL